MMDTSRRYGSFEAGLMSLQRFHRLEYSYVLLLGELKASSFENAIKLRYMDSYGSLCPRILMKRFSHLKIQIYPVEI